MNLDACRQRESEGYSSPANNERKYFAVAYELPDCTQYSLRDADDPRKIVSTAEHSLDVFSKKVNDHSRNIDFPDTNNAQALTRLNYARGLTSQEIAYINGATGKKVNRVMFGKSFE